MMKLYKRKVTGLETFGGRAEESVLRFFSLLLLDSLARTGTSARCVSTVPNQCSDFIFSKDIIFMRGSERRQRHRQREKQAPCREHGRTQFQHPGITP